MAAECKHWASVHRWILKVIDSCTTSAQVCSTGVLIKRYRMNGGAPENIKDHLVDVLNIHRRVKWNSIIQNMVNEDKKTRLEFGTEV